MHISDHLPPEYVKLSLRPTPMKPIWPNLVPSDSLQAMFGEPFCDKFFSKYNIRENKSSGCAVPKWQRGCYMGPDLMPAMHTSISLLKIFLDYNQVPSSKIYSYFGIDPHLIECRRALWNATWVAKTLRCKGKDWDLSPQNWLVTLRVPMVLLQELLLVYLCFISIRHSLIWVAVNPQTSAEHLWSSCW